MNQYITDWWDESNEREKKRARKEESNIFTMEKLKEGAREELSAPQMCSKQTLLALFFYAPTPPPFSHLSLAHPFSEVAIAAGHNVVDFELLAQFW